MTLVQKDVSVDAISLSQQFWYAVRTGNSSANGMLNLLKTFKQELLVGQLKDDAAKKAFWINLYNAGVQWLLAGHPEYFHHKNRFFRKKYLIVAQHPMSLDDIEHGMLRHSRIKWTMGYMSKYFPNNFERNFRVKQLDYRIHFALNCGARSCPPIAFYEPDIVENQLDLAARNYLQDETEYDGERDVLYLPKLLKWYRADFGGRKGIIKMLTNYQIIQPDKEPGLSFKRYDWTVTLKNYMP